MIEQRDRLYIAILMLLGFSLSVFGIRAGLPSPAQTNLVFTEKSVLEDLSPVMKTLRDEVYAHYRSITGNEIRKAYQQPPATVSVALLGTQLDIDKRKIHAMRSALMHTRFPDEPKTWAAFSNIKPALGQFNTHLFHYGGLYIYSVAAAVKAADIVSFVRLTPDTEYYFKNTAALSRMYAVPRIWGTLVALLGIPLAYGCARMMYGRPAGLLAAVLLTVIPAFSIENHFLKPYAFSIPFILGTLFFAYRGIRAGRGTQLIISGLFAGLGTGSLLLNGVFVICPLTAYILLRRGRSYDLRTPSNTVPFNILAAFAAGFILSNPHWIFTPHEAWSELTTQAADSPFIFSWAHLGHHLTREFYKQFTAPVFALVIAGILLAVRRRDAADLLVLTSYVPYYIYIANQFSTNSHYVLPLIPFSVLLAARFGAWSLKTFRWPRTTVAVLAVASLFALGGSVYYDVLIRQWQYAHLDAGRWINTHIPRGASVGTSIYPYFGYRGYPPFNLLDYRVNEVQCPAYYITANNDDPILRTLDFAAAYKPVATFIPQTGLLGRIYRNDIYYMCDQKIQVFARRESALNGKNNAE